MKLYLLRHAKTDQQSSSGKDFDRKLLSKGIEQCKRMKDHLGETIGLHVICSSSHRTRETLQRIDLTDAEVEFLDNLYLCSKETLLRVIWECKSQKNLMVIGHNFGISQLAEYLLEDYIEMKTCELLVFNFDIVSWQQVSRGLGQLIDRYRPVLKNF